MNAQDKELRFEAFVRAYQGLGAFVTEIKCIDGTRWVIDYGKWAPYHAFADRRVLVCGEPGRCLAPSLPRTTGEFRVLTIRLIEVTPDARASRSWSATTSLWQ